MSLSRSQVAGIAEYARIALHDNELDQMTTYLNDTVEHVLDEIRHIDVEGVTPIFHPIGELSNVMRDDVVHPGLDLETVLKNAPRREGASFVIPSILGRSEQ